MNQDDDRPTLAERYVRAAQSSHLKHEHGRCDTDYLRAAGSLEDSLGVALMRLRSEYDTTRAETPADDPLAAHAIALVQMKNLHGVRVRIERLALSLNTEQWAMDQHVAALISGRVLDAWLDPNCRACEGRGYNGGHHRGDHVLRCNLCTGTGKRRVKLAANAVESRFAAMLRDWIESLISRAQGEMNLKLREHVTD
jgi:hypothetical protein